MNYQELYDLAFDKEYKRLIKILKTKLNNRDGVSKHNILFNFKSDLLNKINRCIRKEYKNGSFKRDHYLGDLVSSFNRRKDNYEGDHIKFFFKHEFKTLKKKYEDKKEAIVFSSIYKSNERNTIIFLAKYFAKNKLLIDSDQIYPKEQDSVDDLILSIKGRSSKIENGLNFYNNEELNISEVEIDNASLKSSITLAQQVLIMYYIFDEIGVEGIDITVKARFIQQLTGKQINASNIKNTSIYPLIKNPFRLNDRKLKEDLQFVRKEFEKLGWINLANKVTKEINSKT